MVGHKEEIGLGNVTEEGEWMTHMESVAIEIDMDLCNRCKTCVDACFVDVFRWDAEEEKPVVAYLEDCVWCYACEMACPAKCIEVKPAGQRQIPTPY